MRGYAIAFDKVTDNGIMRKYYSNGQWYDATNFTFNSIDHAVQWSKLHEVVKNRPKLGSDTCPYIIGPRGGIYSIFSGKRRK